MRFFGRFIFRALLVTLIPLAILAAVYALVDPFKVLYDYREDYYAFGRLQTLPNYSMTSIRNYELQSQRRHYNAFLFGSSIAGCIPADYWTSSLPPDAEPYYLNSDQASLRSIASRLQWLDARGDSIRYAIIVITPNELVDHEPYQPGLIAYPGVGTDPSWWRWHWTFVKGFYHRDFLASWIASAMCRQPVEIRSVKAMEHNQYDFIPRSHYMPYRLLEARFAAGAVEPCVNWPADSVGTVHPPTLSTTYRQDFDNIMAVLRRQHTDYRIVIPPNARHHAFHPADIIYMRRQAGVRLIDAYTALDSLTHVDSLWYDPAHFRPSVGRMIIDLGVNLNVR